MCTIDAVDCSNISFFLCSGENYVATLTLGGAGAHATYYHKANDQVLNLT